jgi:hypothetical protein
LKYGAKIATEQNMSEENFDQSPRWDYTIIPSPTCQTHTKSTDWSDSAHARKQCQSAKLPALASSENNSNSGS